MMKVMHYYKCELETVFLAIQILDLFLNVYKGDQVKKHIHLIGATTITIASKMQDIVPVKINILNGVNEMEVFIFQVINYQTILVSPYDFIKSHVYDFKFNASEKINNLNLASNIIILEDNAVFIAKLMLKDDRFNQYR